MISDEVGLAITNACDFEDYTFSSPHNESKSCTDAIVEANKVVGDYVSNVLLDVCYPSIVTQELRLHKYAACFESDIKVQCV
jgi:serine carboxypeptidase-like clade 2